MLDRGKLIDVFMHLDRHIKNRDEYGICYTSDFVEAVEIVLRMLKNEADPVKHGRWIEQESPNMDTYYDCSACGESFCLIDGTPTDNLYNYCPNCGADMRERRQQCESTV